MKEKYHKFDPVCKDLPQKFDILFRKDDKEYKYQLSLLHNEILEENLYMKEIKAKLRAIIFERTKDDCYLGEKLQKIAVGKLKNTMPLISHISVNYDINIIEDVVSWFAHMSFVDPLKDGKFFFRSPKRSNRNYLKC